MDRPLVPHFDLPFRLSTFGGVAAPAVVEQDSLEDVVNCIEAALRTDKGARPELPTFGVADPTFRQIPLDTNQLVDEAQSHEERALMVLSESPDTLDALLDRITVEVGLREEHHV